MNTLENKAAEKQQVIIFKIFNHGKYNHYTKGQPTGTSRTT